MDTYMSRCTVYVALKVITGYFPSEVFAINAPTPQ